MVAMPQKDAFGVFQVARAAREHLVDEEILRGGKMDGIVPHAGFFASLDGFALIGKEGKNKIDPDAGAGIHTGQDAGRPNEFFRCLGDSPEAQAPAGFQETVQVIDVNAKGDIDVFGEPG